MNIWKYIKERQFGKYVLAYIAFVLLNYIMCLAPIGASYYFSTETLLLSSFLAYCFTILAVTVYSFMYFPKDYVGGTILANLGIIAAMLLMVGYIVLFILYNLAGDVSRGLNENMVRTAIWSFIPVLVLTLMLSVPVIRSHVAADKAGQLIKKIRKSEDEGDRVISEISGEGIS